MLVETHGMRRRLSAIMSADVAGYSALMAADEEGTLARLTAHREELIEPAIAEHGGRIVKLMGDGLLVEFPSVVEAVRAGVDIQRLGAERNEVVADDHQIVFRIGINQGDVIIDGDDIYGDDVNIAARLQERAAPGGICISERVHSDIRGKIDVAIDDLGDQELKNIPEPVRVYRVLMGPDDGTAMRLGQARRFPRRGMALATVSLLVILVAAAGAWFWQSTPQIVQIGLLDQPKPSIAVLPFANLSNDPKEEYFSDGITNDIITDLSKFDDLLVIASNAVRGYKGKNISVEEVSRKLGVRYVLEGSVQRANDKVRINAQLVDGASGRHLWAERYNENIEDIFELQDKITRNIVGTLAVRLTDAERKRTLSQPTIDLRAYDLAMRGRQLLTRKQRGANFEARKLFRLAMKRDNEYANAYTWLGHTYMDAVFYGWTGTPGADLERARELAQKTIAIDNGSAPGHALMANIFLQYRKYDLALVELERAVALNPNDAGTYFHQGLVLTWSGHPDGAILAFETAQRFDPVVNPVRSTLLGLAYYLKRQYDDTIASLASVVVQNPDYEFSHVILAATYGQMGRQQEAIRASQEVRRLNPFFSVEEFRKRSLFQDPKNAMRLAEGLRKAGLD
ncbi:MAG: adenylate/guanylate cyclase domain-containing protein [Rhodospirillaceae bacterium]|nr:adenylate/guanylate cyclase domain-containing protein [Rhodospirillaceae bacterium]MBT5457423.1 adenylate/guanylate cyclase domain-containing protein [Rhodospirillaceae bacterium]MBT5895597.1 adenylate/guanylate cyclase domain-containing protein [Rhodospirillaceae bacterium]